MIASLQETVNTSQQCQHGSAETHLMDSPGEFEAESASKGTPWVDNSPRIS